MDKLQVVWLARLFTANAVSLQEMIRFETQKAVLRCGALPVLASLVQQAAVDASLEVLFGQL